MTLTLMQQNFYEYYTKKGIFLYISNLCRENKIKRYLPYKILSIITFKRNNQKQ